MQSPGFRRPSPIFAARALGAACLAALVLVTPQAGAAPALTSGPAILDELRGFATVGSVLHIAAHPDDENTQLIAYLARGRHYRVGYLSLTRGDGGQNEIGPEFGEKLGVARTHELLAAREVDGGRQFFSRAVDFGFSKTPEETLRFWNRQEILADIVRVIREFRPDVIITRFPVPPGSGGHGHHTASGILGVEAFKLAGDTNAFPEQFAEGLQPWQPKRVVWNGFGGTQGLPGSVVKVDIGGSDAVTGESFASIAGRSRAKHVTQGFGNFGGGGRGGPNEQSFMLMGGAPADKDFMDGVDTSWARYPKGAEIGSLTETALAGFDTNNPGASVPALLAIRAKLAALASDPVIDDKRMQLDRILQACLGLTVATTSAEPELVPGESAQFQATVTLHGATPVKWLETLLRYPKRAVVGAEMLTTGQTAAKEISLTVPADAALTQPYWLREEGTTGMSRVDDPKLIGRPENPPAFPVDYVFEIAGQKIVIPDEPKFGVSGVKAGRARKLEIVPPVSLEFGANVLLFAPGATRLVKVEARAARPDQTAVLSITAPEGGEGWKITPAWKSIHLTKTGDRVEAVFAVTAPHGAASARLTASAEVNGRRYENRRVVIDYAHLPIMLLQPKAQTRALSLEVAARGKKAGYLPGAGDDTVAALEQLGYAVTTLTSADLRLERLTNFDAVVTGVRAFNQRSDLKENITNLFAYVAQGGTLIEQYNRPNGLKTETLGPYPLSIQGPAPQLRVTDEQAEVTFLAPDHAALSTPNKIGPADFDGWIQERGAYFASSWDTNRYTALFAMSDPGEAPLRGSTLVAPYGQGYFVYTSLSFFRQLPQGVPGAYRLFANFLSLGK
ncbi:MAG TPA: PIG-L family deacetylase [Verrucomicrobiae bacterium]|jgi:LmbE family N-acetylglucosaminyl deacetylase|nr:PIG-L family deacetylase [Verrucomicrobiae bacterium]